MSTEEKQQISSTSTTEEIINEQYEDNEHEQQQQQEHYEDDDVESQQIQEVHHDSYQTVASSTAESSNRTLRDDNSEQTPVVIPRIPTSYAKFSDRYTYTFSSDLIAQFDNYRAHMRASIRQEIEEDKVEKIEEQPENNEEIFSIHQVHHEPARSIHSNSQVSLKDRSAHNVLKSPKSTSFSDKLKKYFRNFFLCGERENKDRNVVPTMTTTTLSDLATLSSDVDNQHQAPRTITTGSELTN